jgi:signal transduction histidine kinase
MGIREAICVPLQGRHDTMGIIYLDNRVTLDDALTPGKTARRLTDDHLKLLIAIAHQAALAMEDTRYYQAKVQAERLAAVGQTIATLSHDIKNILQGIRGGSHLIEMGLAQGEDDHVRRGWAIVNKNQAKIFNLVMDMLTFSKEREPVFQPTDLNEVVKEVIELVEARAAEIGVALEFQGDPTLPQVWIDPEAIHRAVLNIVSNALDATEQKANGTVQVRTSPDPTKPFVQIQVIDNGKGIPADEIPQMFTLFRSTKGARGTGIGLPVSDKIVQEHGGKIQVSSQPGEGAEFVISLPIRMEPAPMDESEESQEPRSSDSLAD